MKVAARERLARNIVTTLKGRFVEVATLFADDPDFQPVVRPVLDVRAYKADGEVYLAMTTPTREPQGIEPKIRVIKLKTAKHVPDDGMWLVDSGDGMTHGVEEASPAQTPDMAKRYREYRRKDMKAASKLGLDEHIASELGQEITP